MDETFLICCLFALRVIYCDCLFDELVKEKRWVKFKGEEDSTSIPGIFISTNH